jgi:prepilin signal peptidase PulO-like enzyme (type II secretory pathway)
VPFLRLFVCDFLLYFLPDFYIKPVFSSLFLFAFFFFEFRLMIFVTCLCGALWGSGGLLNETRQEPPMLMLQGFFRG